MPAVLSEEPLPADPEAEARLAGVVAAAAAEPDPQTVELGETAAAVDGVRYDYRSDDRDGEWFEIEFLGDTAVWRGEYAAGPHEWIVGLDGRYVVNDDPPLALRGAWTTDTTFVVEVYVIGQADRGMIHFSFTNGSARVVETSLADSGSAQADAVP